MHLIAQNSITVTSTLNLNSCNYNPSALVTETGPIP